MSQNFDLFGDPIPENWAERGHSLHILTAENQTKISMLCAFGSNNEWISGALHLPTPSPFKHYLSQYRLEASWQDRPYALTARKIEFALPLGWI